MGVSTATIHTARVEPADGKTEAPILGESGLRSPFDTRDSYADRFGDDKNANESDGNLNERSI